MTDLPLLGAALPTSAVETMQDFILSENRDLELQDFFDADLLNGDWKPVADRAKALLSGYTGRLGIHGPFWGLSIASPDPDMRGLNTRKYMQGLEVCEYLGATQMVIHAPYSTWDFNNLDSFPDRSAYDRVLECCHLTMIPVVRRAEEIGVTMVVEKQSCLLSASGPSGVYAKHARSNLIAPLEGHSRGGDAPPIKAELVGSWQ